MAINPLLITALAGGLSPIIKQSSKVAGALTNSLTTKTPTKEGNEFLKHLHISSTESKLGQYFKKNNINSKVALKAHIEELKNSLTSKLAETLPDLFSATDQLRILEQSTNQLEIQTTKGQSLLVGTDTSIGKLAAQIDFLEKVDCSYAKSSNTLEEHILGLPLAAKNSSIFI